MIFLEWELEWAVGKKREWAVRELVEIARSVGLSEATLDRAKQRLPIRAERRGGFAEKGQSYWRLESKSAVQQLRDELAKEEAIRKQVDRIRPQLRLPLDRQ